MKETLVMAGIVAVVGGLGFFIGQQSTETSFLRDCEKVAAHRYGDIVIECKVRQPEDRK